MALNFTNYSKLFKLIYSLCDLCFCAWSTGYLVDRDDKRSIEVYLGYINIIVQNAQKCKCVRNRQMVNIGRCGNSAKKRKN